MGTFFGGLEQRKNHTMPRTRIVLLWILLGGLLLVLLLGSRKKTPSLQKARQLHHAEPPLGQSALHEYDKALATGDPRALLPKATLLDHGVLQGPEPVAPNRDMAIGYYRQVAVLGDVREQALARDRLIELGDRALFNPPPRRHAPVAVHPARAHQERAGDVVALQRPVHPQLGGPQSDSQNVHDSTVVKSVKAALDKLPPSSLSTEESLKQVRDRLVATNNEHALKGLDLMERNTVPLTALKMTEVDILRKVWGRIHTETDPVQKENMMEMLESRLAESGQEASCASGRVGRVVDALSTFDDRVNLRPLWALRQEMLNKAAALRSQPYEGSFVDMLRRTFHKDYVDTGLVSASVLAAELETWGQDLD